MRYDGGGRMTVALEHFAARHIQQLVALDSRGQGSLDRWPSQNPYTGNHPLKIHWTRGKIAPNRRAQRHANHLGFTLSTLTLRVLTCEEQAPLARCMIWRWR